MNLKRLLSLLTIFCSTQMLVLTLQAGPCATVTIENQSASATTNKCGYTECPGGPATGSCSASTPPRIYLTSTTSGMENWYSHQYYPTFPINQEIDESFTGQYQAISTMSQISCTASATYSGSVTYVWWNHTGGPPYAGTYVTNTDTIDPTTGEWGTDLYGDTYQSLIADDDDASLVYDRSVDANQLSPTVNHYTTSGTANMPSPYSYYEGFHWDQLVTLSDEYTDEMLRQYTTHCIPLYSGTWIAGSGVAFYNLSSDHTTASCGKMKYRLHITDCVPRENYKVKWYEVTVYQGSLVPSVTRKEARVTGSDDPVAGVYTPETEVQVPSTPSTIFETSPRVIPVSPAQ